MYYNSSRSSISSSRSNILEVVGLAISTGKSYHAQTTAVTLFERLGPLAAQKGSPESMTGSRNKSKTWLNFWKTEKIYLKRS